MYLHIKNKILTTFENIVNELIQIDKSMVLHN